MVVFSLGPSLSHGTHNIAFDTWVSTMHKISGDSISETILNFQLMEYSFLHCSKIFSSAYLG